MTLNLPPVLVGRMAPPPPTQSAWGSKLQGQQHINVYIFNHLKKKKKEERKKKISLNFDSTRYACMYTATWMAMS